LWVKTGGSAVAQRLSDLPSIADTPGRCRELPLGANIGRSTNCHALVVRVDTGRRPNDVDLAALTHSPTTFVHNLGGRLRCVKCAKVGIHLG
jgi:hypothetical protein